MESCTVPSHTLHTTAMAVTTLCAAPMSDSGIFFFFCNLVLRVFGNEISGSGQWISCSHQEIQHFCGRCRPPLLLMKLCPILSGAKNVILFHFQHKCSFSVLLRIIITIWYYMVLYDKSKCYFNIRHSRIKASIHSFSMTASSAVMGNNIIIIHCSLVPKELVYLEEGDHIVPWFHPATAADKWKIRSTSLNTRKIFVFCCTV